MGRRLPFKKKHLDVGVLMIVRIKQKKKFLLKIIKSNKSRRGNTRTGIKTVFILLLKRQDVGSSYLIV